jgi:prevent-host-death family protein
MSGRDRISIEELRRSLGSVAREVEGGRSMVVERRNQEAFALVPMRLYRYLEEERRRLLQSTDQARKSFSDLSAEEAEELAAGEIRQSGEHEASPPRSAAG